MICREIRLERYGWSVMCFIGYTNDNTSVICRTLESMECKDDALNSAYEHLSKDSGDRGLTYSNVKERRSVVAIGKSQSNASIVNTIGHELFHVVAHICSTDGIEVQSEEPCYIMGELCEQLFISIK